MRLGRALVVSGILVVGLVTAAAGQERPVIPSADDAVAAGPAVTAQQQRELTKWLSAMDKWLAEEKTYFNRPRHSDWGKPIGHRPRPEPPEWLPESCRIGANAAVLYPDALTRACGLLDGDAAPAATAPPPAVAAEGPDKHTSFMARVHVDTLWMNGASQGRLYGLVGSHLSLVDVGRLQIFGPPGVMLLSVPDGGDSRRITLAYTWGFSVRLAEVRMFGPNKDMTLFLNMSKAWVNGTGPQGTTSGFDGIGLSLAPRKKP
jgi:hypothetical protein